MECFRTKTKIAWPVNIFTHIRVRAGYNTLENKICYLFAATLVVLRNRFSLSFIYKSMFMINVPVVRTTLVSRVVSSCFREFSLFFI